MYVRHATACSIKIAIISVAANVRQSTTMWRMAATIKIACTLMSGTAPLVRMAGTKTKMGTACYKIASSSTNRLRSVSNVGKANGSPTEYVSMTAAMKETNILESANSVSLGSLLARMENSASRSSVESGTSIMGSA